MGPAHVRSDLMQVSLELERDPDKYATTGVASRVGDLMGLQDMIWNGRPIDVFDNRGWSPLHEAAFYGNTGCLEILLRLPNVDPDWITHAKETPLILAARQGHYEAVSSLLNYNADKNFTTNEGYTPLWEALNSGNYLCFKSLVKKDVDLNSRIYTGYSALHLAAEKGLVHHLSLLLQHGADLDVYADHNLSPLFLACHKGNLDCVKVLVKCAKDRGQLDVVNVAASDNATPLLIAAQEGYTTIVAYLLHYGADANIAVNDENLLPLHFAVCNGHTKCVELLLPHTTLSDLKSQSFHPMHPQVQALKHTDTQILKLLHSHFDFSRICSLPSSLLLQLGHLANTLLPTRKGGILCLIDSDWPANGVEFLLQQGLSVETSDEDELPPLLVALWSNNVPLFQLLLRYGASPNIYHKNVTGNVAMLLAFQKDLERDLTAMIVRNSRQPNFQVFYIWQLFLGGAEAHSLFDLTDPIHGDSGNSPAITNLFGLMFHMFHRKENLVPVLALLMCISDHAALPPHILTHFEAEQTKVLQNISQKTNSLAHRCRRKVVFELGKKNRYCQSAMEQLKIPSVLQDYLMFSELEPPLQDMILKFITANSEEGMEIENNE